MGLIKKKKLTAKNHKPNDICILLGANRFIFFNAVYASIGCLEDTLSHLISGNSWSYIPEKVTVG